MPFYTKVRQAAEQNGSPRHDHRVINFSFTDELLSSLPEEEEEEEKLTGHSKDDDDDYDTRREREREEKRLIL